MLVQFDCHRPGIPVYRHGFLILHLKRGYVGPDARIRHVVADKAGLQETRNGHIQYAFLKIHRLSGLKSRIISPFSPCGRL